MPSRISPRNARERTAPSASRKRRRRWPDPILCAAALVEPLEQRTLLTALVNGVFTNTNTIYDGQRYFEFIQADGSFARISVRGNVTAEFIGGAVKENEFTVGIRNLVPATAQGADGINLFQIYVVRSDLNSVISIANVPSPTSTARPMQPFNSNAGTIQTSDASTGAPLSLSLGSNTGGVYIGARTDNTVTELDNIPLFSTSRRNFGLRPSSAGAIYAGVEVAAGNDIGRLLIGGTVTGRVILRGDCQLFYAGNILTGDPTGIPPTSSAGIADNFYVGGDLENLVVAGSIGTGTLARVGTRPLTNIQYKSGTQIHVRGRLGQVKTGDAFLGAITVDHNKNVRGTGVMQQEIEFRATPFPTNGSQTFFDPAFPEENPLGGTLGDIAPNPLFFNDTFDSAQYLGTLYSQQLNDANAIQLHGRLFPVREPVADNDGVDYYAVALLGGQTMEIQLLESTAGIGVFDPDGRLIATDYDNLTNDRINRPFRITADRPGPYRIAIASRGDTNFNGLLDAGETITDVVPDLYQLRIRRAGDIALGGLIAGQHIATMDLGNTGINVRRGDLGAIRAATNLITDGTIFSISNPWTISKGSFRSMEAASMGVLENNRFVGGSGPDFLVPGGNVGLLRVYGTDVTNSWLTVNENLTINGTNNSETITPFLDITQISSTVAVGGDIQLVDAQQTNLEGNLLANRGIGVIRAFNVSAFVNPPVWAVNVDKRHTDGVIDLVDIGNSLGTLGRGGPAISTGPGGNVRYIHVNTQGAANDAPTGITDVRDLLVFVDQFFGGGAPQETTFQPGETARLTDDSGTAVAITPIPLVQNLDPVTGLPTIGFNNPGQLRVLAYPIRGKAGTAIINVTAYPGADGSGRGVEVTAGGRGTGGSVEIGEIEVRSPGTDLNFNEFTRTFTPVANGQNADIILRGKGRVDVWSVEGRDPASDTTTGITRLENQTSGELVNGLASDYGSIVADTIGLAQPHTGAAVNGIDVRAGATPLTQYPWNQQRNLMEAAGDAGSHHIASVVARRAVGNLFANGGTIGTVVANGDGRNIPGFEGINAPIYATTNAADPDQGNIVAVNIGEGVLPSGTGDVGLSGIFADNIIGRVSGSRADIRGDIVASGAAPGATQIVNGVISSTPGFTIGDIVLTNGSIIDADVVNYTTIAQSRENVNGVVIPSQEDPLNAPIFDINSIQIRGNGGIIGADIAAEDVGLITISGGFGFLDSALTSLGDSVVDGVVADGYGVRRSRIRGGAVINTILARGTGKLIDARGFSAQVRLSENANNRGFDPFSGLSLTAANDLHQFLGTSKTKPKLPGISVSGLIEDDVIVGSRELGRLEGQRILARNVFTTGSNGQQTRIPFGDARYPMRVSFGNLAHKIIARDLIDGLSLQSGGLDLLQVKNDMMNSQLASSGRIRRIIATNGTIRGTNTISAEGPEGTIESINTKASFSASVVASLDIRSIQVGTQLASPTIRAGRNVSMLQVKGNVLGNTDVSVGRTLGTLIIGRDVKAGARIAADAIQTQQIGGQVFGDIVIT
jgi:hypothetical protein